MSEQQGKHSIFLLLIFLLINIFTLQAQQVHLTWKQSENPNVSYYSIYRKSLGESGFTLLNNVSSLDTLYIDENVQCNSCLSYAITAVDQLGNESGFSNIVEVTTSPTPVELSHFSGYVNENETVLEWTTATESNNYGFEIQRSEGINSNFEKIGFVEGNGTSSVPIRYRFIDENKNQKDYFYRLKQIDFNGEYSFTEVVQMSKNVVDNFQFFQNYPNPFNSITTISYSIPISSKVEVKIFNTRGQIVSELVNEFQQAGQHNINWHGTDFAGSKVTSGVYYCKIIALNTTKFTSMTIIN